MKDEVCSWTLVERNMLGTGGGDGDRGRFEDMFGISMELGFLVGLVGWMVVVVVMWFWLVGRNGLASDVVSSCLAAVASWCICEVVFVFLHQT
jgi:hypothetical protein